MKQITIRGIPAEVEKAIKKESRQKNLSLNKAIISLLEKTVNTKRKQVSSKILYHDLDHLSGVWSKDEAKEFEKNLREQRQIDEDIWK